jgi:hypothetical protein
MLNGQCFKRVGSYAQDLLIQAFSTKNYRCGDQVFPKILVEFDYSMERLIMQFGQSQYWNLLACNIRTMYICSLMLELAFLSYIYSIMLMCQF